MRASAAVSKVARCVQRQLHDLPRHGDSLHGPGRRFMYAFFVHVYGGFRLFMAYLFLWVSYPSFGRFD